jgi:magnesium chelatase accessory protein
MTGSRAQELLTDAPAATDPVVAAGLSVQVEGTGPDILLIHGLSANRTEWAAVLDALGTGYRTISPDLPGRGETPASRDMRFGLEEEVDRLYGLCERLKVRRPLVVGHSHGAALALALTARRDCAGLLLINPVSRWTRRPPVLSALHVSMVRRLVAPFVRHYRDPLTRYILTRRVFVDPGMATEATVRRYSSGLADARRVESILRVLADWRPNELAPYDGPCGIPVRLVTGRHDRRAPPAEVERWARSLGSECVVLDDCAHGVPEEAPQRVVDMILELDRHRTSGRTEST